LEAPDKAIAAAAKATLGTLKIDPNARNLPLVGKLKYEDLVPLVINEKGDPATGLKLFQRTGCVNCHTVTPAEPPKGPMLAGITARYNRNELLESIIKPSVKLAQGFETHIFELSSGKKVTGFIVKESGAEVEVRDANGVVTIIKKDDIEERKTSPTSVMPEKLADNLTAPELASILAYLESLKK
jgi:putative heme-binding domain-containing protein